MCVCVGGAPARLGGSVHVETDTREGKGSRDIVRLIYIKVGKYPKINVSLSPGGPIFGTLQSTCSMTHIM